MRRYSKNKINFLATSVFESLRGLRSLVVDTLLRQVDRRGAIL